jgi:hypothetical protein
VWSEERFLKAFRLDAHTHPALRDRLCDSLGFCAAHTRTVLADVPDWLATTVYADIYANASALWDAGNNRRRFTGLCPLCADGAKAVSTLLASLVEALGIPAVSSAFRGSGGLCLVHTWPALRKAGRTATQYVVRAALANGCLRARAADPDAQRRARLRGPLRELGNTIAGRKSADILAELAVRLGTGACPFCLACGLIEQETLAWLAQEYQRDRAGLAADGVSLCSLHSHDLYGQDHAASDYVADLEWPSAARALQAELEWRRKPGAAVLLRGFRTTRAAAVPFNACVVCRKMEMALRQERALLLAALRDRQTAVRYLSSNGLCIRHALGLRDSGSARAHDVADLIHALAGARLAVLGWELQDAARRAAWDARMEEPRSGGKTTPRAAALLDGGVFAGLPGHLAPALR